MLGAGAATVGTGLVLASCNGGDDKAITDIPKTALDVAKQRGLNEQDVIAAVKTYTPTGMLDTHYMMTSGGHSGQMWVVGIPSMRVLKVIPVFAHSPYQGYGYTDESKEVLAGGVVDGRPQTQGDTHHPALSETDGVYDGQYCFINDKINARVAVIDLKSFHTRQIVKNPLTIDDHGHACTPNTEYIIETSQYATPLGWEYAEMTEASYNDNYRGTVRFWRFDRDQGLIDEENSFSMELPPYQQDLADSGKGVSDGWGFCNCFNSERAIVGQEEPIEKSASSRDMDYLHVFNWRAAEKAFQDGKIEEVNGTGLITLQTAIDEGLLYLVPEPKSPHGCDVSPDGNYIVVAGKLDPHVTVYSFEKIQAAIESGNFEKDPYGIPILDFDSCMEAQIEVGLGPLHTQFDNNGNAYTSLFLESAVARWSLGGSYSEDGWKALDKLPIHYNVGHVTVAGGDTTEPDGQYLVSLNKWSLDRFLGTGPHHTPNIQLIDIQSSDSMQLLYDLPLPDAESHYAQIISADKLDPYKIYEAGWNAHAGEKDPNAVASGNERVERDGNTVHVYMGVMRSNLKPDFVEVNEGDTVIWHITDVESAENASHGFTLPYYDVGVTVDPGETVNVTMTADHAGTYPYYCTEFCSALHIEMMGYLLIKPAS